MEKMIYAVLLSISIYIMSGINNYGQLPDDFPGLTTIKTGDTAPGYIFLTVSADVEGIGYYVFMIDDEGQPFKYKKLENDYAYDFKVQPNGLLSYAQFLSHHAYTGGGNCIHMVLDEEMKVVDSFQLKNGYIAEAHDFQMLPNGHVLAFGYYLTQMDLSEVVEGGYPNAMVSGGVVQELDQDKNVVWQWRSWDHYDYKDYEFGRRSSHKTVSEFHLNTINLDTDGHIFLASPEWTKKINRQTGKIMWHLGGEENEFSFVGVDSLEGISDVAGHAFHRLENGHVLVYENGPRRGDGTSEAHEYKLDEENKIAEKIKTFTPEEDIPAWHRGNAQRLPNGNTLVGWGGASGDPIPTCTEFDSLGNTIFEAFFDNPLVESYRALRFPYPPKPTYTAYIEETGPGNIYDLMQGDTLDLGIDVQISDIVSVGYNEFIVHTYDYAPQFPRFDERAPMVLPQKIVLDKYSINYIEGDISFDIEAFGITNPENITLYYRGNENDGIFIPLPTDFNSVTNEITATFDGFGELIFTYPDLEHQLYTPTPRSPKKGQLMNYLHPVILEWSQDGFFNSFSLQVSEDEDFASLMTDESGLVSTIYELKGLPVDRTFYWRIKTHNDAGISEWSETATFHTIAPYVEITAPNGDEIWKRGLDHFIEWNSNAEGQVIIDLYKDNVKLMTIDTVDNNNGYRWSLPDDLVQTCDYYIMIKSAADPAIQDVSDSTFAINEPSCTRRDVPFIKVLSPNGGEIINKADNYVISWLNTTGETVSIDLYKDGEYLKNLFTGIPQNTIQWSIGNDIDDDYDYRVVIRSEGSHNVSDASNSNFEITGTNDVNNRSYDQHVHSLRLYPNPAEEDLHLDFLLEREQIMQISVYNLKGEKVKSFFTGQQTPGIKHFVFDISALKKGTYFLKIQTKKTFMTKTFERLK